MTNEDFVIGRNAVTETLKAGRSVNKILVAKGSNDGSIKKILALAKDLKIVVEFVERSKLDKICGGERHQGIIAQVAAIQYSSVEEILEIAASKKEPPFIVLLDELEDPHNFGAILRTADAAGVHGVIIQKRRSVSLNSTVAKTSAGAMEYVKVAQVTNVAQTLKNLREEGLKIVGAALSGGIVLVIGNEGKGIRRLTRENCDLLVKIPMRGEINSLNASVAGAILMYEVFKQRNF